MAEEWDKYIVQDQTQPQQDEWSQYAVESPMAQPNQKPNLAQNMLSAGAGVGMAGLGAWGLMKSGIPQGIGGGISKLSSGILNMPKVINHQKGTNFAEEIRSSFIKSHTDVVNKFGADIDKLSVKYPQAKVNLSELVSDLQTNPDISKQTLNILKKVPKLKDILKNPKYASNVSLRDAQDIVNHLQTKIPKNIRANNFDLLDTINTIKGQQLEAFPEMAGARAEYAKFIEPYKNVKQYFRFNKLLESVKNKFGGAEGQAAVEKIFPKEVIKKLGGYRAAAKLAEIPQDLPIVGRLFKSMGGALGVAPMALQAIDFAGKMKEMKEAAKKSKSGKVMYRLNDMGMPEMIKPEDLAI
jgi:hypothetical protein